MASGQVAIQQYADGSSGIDIFIGPSQSVAPIRILSNTGDVIAQINQIGNMNVAAILQKQQQPTINTVMASTDINFFVDTTAGNIQITIANPGIASASTTLGRLARFIRVMKTTANANTVTVLVAAGGNINGGGTSYVLTQFGQCLDLCSMPLSDTTGAWFVMGNSHNVEGLKTITTTPYVPLYHDYVILADATAGAIAVNLPAASGVVGVGRPLLIKKIDASANAVTVNRNGADTIEGAAAVALAAQWNSTKIQSNGSTVWVKV